MEALLDVWRGVVQRVYHYYQLSAKAYFKFLKLNGGVSGSFVHNSVLLLKSLCCSVFSCKDAQMLVDSSHFIIQL